MQSLNTVILSGYLGADPESLESKDGKTYTRLSLATHQAKRKGENQPWSLHTHWHKVLVFGRQSLLCQTRLHKGDRIAIEGMLSSISNKNADGQTFRQVAVLANRVSFIEVKENQVDDED
ncbi:MAG: single-stranded DNA-binding protein [Bdellovibrionaceae bacterium]|nr:single-stranded DNA-binding protein [Bdellovibrionales bacterium]MCB9084826.1 single-stranded DNA-binding protein [Pseudobdellovibrionaceae bacterium]